MEGIKAATTVTGINTKKHMIKKRIQVIRRRRSPHKTPAKRMKVMSLPLLMISLSPRHRMIARRATVRRVRRVERVRRAVNRMRRVRSSKAK